MSKNVLILSASPRKGGNSDLLCDAFAQGAKEAGHTVEKFTSRIRKSAAAWPATAVGARA